MAIGTTAAIALGASAAVGAGASVAGAVIQGEAAGKSQKFLESEAAKLEKERAEALAARGKAASELAGYDLNLPDVPQQRVQFDVPEYVGDLIASSEQKIGRPLTPLEKRTLLSSPQVEQAMALGPSAMEDIEISDILPEAQFSALEKQQERGETGFTAQEMAEQATSQRRASQAAQQRRESILQNMAQRGTLGSGMELASALEDSQSAAEMQAEQDRQIASLGAQRALEATSRAGMLAGDIRAQEFGEKEKEAQAKDLFAQFNLRNSQDVQLRNIDRAQRAVEMQFEADLGLEQRNVERDYQSAMQEYRYEVERQQRNIQAGREVDYRNLAEKQRLAEAATAIRNQQQVTNNAYQQQQYANQMGQAEMKYGQLRDVQGIRTQQLPTATGTGQSQAALAMQQGQNTANLIGGIGQSLAGAGTAIADYSMNKKPTDAQARYYDAKAQQIEASLPKSKLTSKTINNEDEDIVDFGKEKTLIPSHLKKKG